MELGDVRVGMFVRVLGEQMPILDDRPRHGEIGVVVDIPPRDVWQPRLEADVDAIVLCRFPGIESAEYGQVCGVYFSKGRPRNCELEEVADEESLVMIKLALGVWDAPF